MALRLLSYGPGEGVTLPRLVETPADVRHQRHIDDDRDEEEALLVDEGGGLEVGGSRHQLVSGAQVATVHTDLGIVGVLYLLFYGWTVVNDGCKDAEEDGETLGVDQGDEEFLGVTGFH